MQIVIRNPDEVAAFRDPAQVIEFVDERGKVIGVYTPDGYGALPEGYPFGLTFEEYERRRKEPAVELDLAGFFADLERGEGVAP